MLSVFTVWQRWLTSIDDLGWCAGHGRYEWLKAVRLTKLFTPLRRLGVSEVADLEDLEPEHVASLKLLPVSLARFKRAVASVQSEYHCTLAPAITTTPPSPHATPHRLSTCSTSPRRERTGSGYRRGCSWRNCHQALGVATGQGDWHWQLRRRVFRNMAWHHCRRENPARQLESRPNGIGRRRDRAGTKHDATRRKPSPYRVAVGDLPPAVPGTAGYCHGLHAAGLVAGRVEGKDGPTAQYVGKAV